MNRCKDHGGPLGKVNDLKTLVKKTKDKQDLHRHLRNEIIFRRQIQPNDHRQRPHLYKVNKMSTDDLLQNLTLLLSDYDAEDLASSSVCFPTAQEMVNTLNLSESSDSTTAEINNENDTAFQYLQPLAVVWWAENSAKWYIGFFLSGTHNKNCMMIDHLAGADGEWMRPKQEEILEVNVSQILPVSVKGDWVIERERSMKYVVSNWKEIDGKKMELESKN